MWCSDNLHQKNRFINVLLSYEQINFNFNFIRVTGHICVIILHVINFKNFICQIILFHSCIIMLHKL